MADFYKDVLQDVLPEYKAFKKRYNRLHSSTCDEAEKKRKICEMCHLNLIITGDHNKETPLRPLCSSCYSVISVDDMTTKATYANSCSDYICDNCSTETTLRDLMKLSKGFKLCLEECI